MEGTDRLPSAPSSLSITSQLEERLISDKRDRIIFYN